jgi:predicted transcriptional regulator
MKCKRNKLDIIKDILSAINKQQGIIKPTHLLYKANLSHNKLKEYTKLLINKKMIKEVEIKKRKYIEITIKGQQYLAEYRKIMKFTDSLGF